MCARSCGGLGEFFDGDGGEGDSEGVGCWGDFGVHECDDALESVVAVGVVEGLAKCPGFGESVDGFGDVGEFLVGGCEDSWRVWVFG